MLRDWVLSPMPVGGSVGPLWWAPNRSAGLVLELGSCGVR